jgi:hypothetical protein
MEWVAGSQLFEINKLEVVDQHSAGWNQIADWLKAVDSVRNQ